MVESGITVVLSLVSMSIIGILSQVVKEDRPSPEPVPVPVSHDAEQHR